MSNLTRRKLELAMRITGLKASPLGPFAGVAASTFSRYLAGSADSEIKQSTMEKLEEAMRTHIQSGKASPEQITLYQEEYLPLVPGSKMPDIAGPEQEVAYAASIPPRPLESFHSGPMDIEVRGTAMGGLIGAMQITSETVEFVRRPPSLMTAKNAFAIYVRGDSMVPQHNPGELRFVHPDRPAAPGDSVIIETYNPATKEKEAFIKIFQRRDGNRIICKQHNPEATIEYIIPDGPAPEKTDKYAVNVWKVLTMNELLGY
ncbi:Peptidase S24-like [Cohaesibacter sp. ES.047]|uniref:S24 family peptidase n=1 Tax=Cohaesibacter sp. ES.047 TaxID=1798205 RepID=UPI000BB8626C|nr:S24 family peptidase [Cohaesibacter sp. ES.047]SNY94098.1 Peptidase S24-like [Cohaesibacter sp. ES.047]